MSKTSTKKQAAENSKGLKLDRYFTKDGIPVYELFKYDKRSSIIRNPSGDAVFEMNDVEVPSSWSQVATDILAQKYFRKAGVPQADGTTGAEKSIKQVAHRMANCWKVWGEKYNYFASAADAQVFYDEIVYTIVGQLAAPNSPQWFNTGLHTSYDITGKPQGHYYVDPATGKLSKSTSAYERPQPHACFILSVDDDLVNDGGIMDLWVREARIFKYGSGVGTNFSKIRGDNEKLSGGGYSSGLMSFLKIGDRAAGAIKSGGTTRRAAKMVCLDLDHPEIESFVNWKVEEEKKVAALIAAGYSSDYEGEAYRTVSGQNSNNSVRIPNAFFNALKGGKPWDLISRMSGKAIKSIPAQKLWDDIAFAAWACADPGVQFDTTINEWHTCPEGGRINASNPCSEYMFLDNTACNLASINLEHFFDKETRAFDVKGFEHACRIWTIVLEISVLMAQFPSKEVAQLSYDYRTLGLGYANLGSALMVNGIPYDSDKARAIGGAITAIMTGTAYATSAEMARELGTFSRYEENKKHMLRVMRNHRYAAYNSTGNYEGLEIAPPGIDQKHCPDYLLSAACNAWDKALEMGEKYGYRNAQTTVIAPTGTIGLVMDCDTTGIEPDFALVKFKKLSGGGYFKIINQAVPAALRNLGYAEHEIDTIINYAKGSATLNNAPHINLQSLKTKGFTDAELEKLDKAMVSAFEVSFGFNVWTVGEDCLKRLGFTTEQYNAHDFNLLRALGFSKQQIAEANEYICGTMTVEGAPYLKQEHYEIFDCANKCGAKGERYIHAHGHIKMMAAAQPFLSGAISKTINLPNEAQVDEIKDCYELSWALGLKANALYRDGCKLSQPLSTKSDVKEEADDKLETVEEVLGEAANVKLSDLTPEQVIEAAIAIMEKSKDTNFMRELSRVVQKKSLPAKRRGFTQKASIDGQTVFVRTGEYEDGTLGEIFVDMHKEGATFRSLMNCFAIAVSVGLQYGVPLEEYVEKFTFTRFEPAGMVMGHDNIKSATSIIDYIFRMLGYEYQNRTDLVHVLTEQNGITGNPQLSDDDFNPDQSNVYEPVAVNNTAAKKQVSFDVSMGVQSDAPACNVCGHTTVRSGTCYKCLNCGSSMGCS
ncbi:vitamin B12-dependent ribonucleotide reductase [Mucilaginibacter boryungensis]|uniref:Vitamin B12-dependent ribonucleotide reductase n=1 Tax=Mucilaginibacter boryungensis TaxID=768480 RepID=A0ABR9XNC8_9SPHI|nr:vitamin B12-dependent ribonucleotide reductase [Mucilaginibacter boryungensis]MBE9668737.1 vitamin B12-dependent ribonucleotide reductase [Mucilaginibacter boryungensis]